MPTSSGLSPERAKELKDQGWSHVRIAELYGITVSGVQQILRAGGYTKPQLSHKAAIPWTVAKIHQQDTTARYLRYLSTLSQGGRLRKYDKPHQDIANTVINWANSLLDNNLDIDYDETEGFSEVVADPKDWHIAKLMQRVITAQTRKL